jgi:hypothetical protein
LAGKRLRRPGLGRSLGDTFGEETRAFIGHPSRGFKHPGTIADVGHSQSRGDKGNVPARALRKATGLEAVRDAIDGETAGLPKPARS